MKYHNRWYTVLDPDLQVGEGGRGEGSGGHSDPEKMGGEVSKKFFFNFFPTLGLQFGLKIRGGGVGRTSPGSARNFPSYRSYSNNFSHM